MRRLLAVAGLVVLALTGCQPEAQTDPNLAEQAQGATNVPGLYAVFNQPDNTGTRDYRIKDEVARLIQNSPKGSYIRIAMFLWTTDHLNADIKAALCRGVIVRLVVDEQNGGAASEFAAGGVIHDLSSYVPPAATCPDGLRLELTRCNGTGAGSACIAGFDREGTIMHDKIFTFSTTTDPQGNRIQRVVVQGSWNNTYSQNNYWNDMVVSYEDWDWYDYWVGYHNDLRGGSKTTDYYNPTTGQGYYSSPNAPWTAYFFPRTGNDNELSSDTVTNNFTDYIKTYVSGCTLDVNQNHFNDSRVIVATELVRIGKLGCRVRVLYTDMDAGIKTKLTGAKNITLRQLYDVSANNVKTSDGTPREVLTHSKHFVYSGNFNGTVRKMVLTGSHNLSKNSLRYNDENLVKFYSDALWQAYHDNFEKGWAQSLNDG
ncbi:phospholipase D-like domain-containing protein [Corallococcus exiguus]|uniref:phospholipase D-like domain-containing protein n=1 Tax=Corallococcus exiguus TaxID=83462 RepID=UPI003DA4C133